MEERISRLEKQVEFLIKHLEKAYGQLVETLKIQKESSAKMDTFLRTLANHTHKEIG